MIFSYFLKRFEFIEYEDFVSEYGQDLVAKSISQLAQEMKSIKIECRFPFPGDSRFGEMIFTFAEDERFAFLLNGSKRDIEITALQKSAPDWSWGYFVPTLCMSHVEKPFRRFQIEVMALLTMWLIVHQENQRDIAIDSSLKARLDEERQKLESVINVVAEPSRAVTEPLSAEIEAAVIFDETLALSEIAANDSLFLKAASQSKRVSDFFVTVNRVPAKSTGFGYREKLLLKSRDSLKVFLLLTDGSIIPFHDWESSSHFAIKTKIMRFLHDPRNPGYQKPETTAPARARSKDQLQFLWGWTRSEGQLMLAKEDPSRFGSTIPVCKVSTITWSLTKNETGPHDLKSLKFQMKLLPTHEIGVRQFRFSGAKFGPESIFNQYMHLNQGDLHLTFFDLSEFNEGLTAWMEDHYFEFEETNWVPAKKKTLLQQLRENSEIQFTLKGHSKISKALSDLSQFPDQMEVSSGETIPLEPHFQSHLDVDKEKLQINTEFNIDGESYTISNFDEAWVFLSQGWQEGIAAMTPLEIDELASRRRSPVRQNDLKLLRHAGFFHFLLLETLSFELFGKDTLDQSLSSREELFEVILKRGALLLFKEEFRVQDLSLRTQCSVKVVALIKTVFTQWLDFFSSPVGVWLENKTVSLSGFHRHRALFFYRFLKGLMEITRGDLLLRKKSALSPAPIFPAAEISRPDFGFDDFFELRQTLLWNRGGETSRFKKIFERLGTSKDFTPEDMALLENYARWGDRQRSSLDGHYQITAGGVKPSDVVTYPFLNSEDKPLFTDLQWLSLFSPEDPFQVRLRGLSVVELNDKNLEIRFSAAGEEAQGKATMFDWFELNPQFFLNGKEISVELAQQLSFEGVIEYQGQLYRIDKRTIPKWRVLDQFWERLQNPKGLGRKNQGGSSERIFRLQALEVLALKGLGHDIEGDGKWRELIAHYENLGKEDKNMVFPAELDGVLKDYQKIGVHWLKDLYELRLGGILADDMGLGKTLQSLTFLSTLKKEGKLDKALVIIPASLVFGWKKECEKFTPDLKLRIFEGRSEFKTFETDESDPGVEGSVDTSKMTFDFSDADVVLCTYHLLTLYTDYFKNQKWNIVIFDEAQNLKTLSTKRYEAAKQIQSQFKMALTGTPLENHLIEFYSILNIVVPGSLGGLSQFKADYNPEKKDFVERVQFLKLKLKPLVLRRKKQEVLKELSEKSETTIEVPFIKKQKDLYKKIALSWNQTVQESVTQEGVGKSQMAMLTALLRLRQVCSDPAGIPDVKFPEVPPKLELVADRIEELVEEGHSVVVFTQFIATLQRVEGLFSEKKISFNVLHGSLSRKAREQALEDFNVEHSEGQGKVLLMTLKTGGVGLNLTKASYVFHLDPWWNPAAENQASDRVHRIGQKKSVFVYRLIMKESVEEKMELLKARKSKLFNDVFGDDFFNLESSQKPAEESLARAVGLSKDDFDYLLGLEEL